MSARRKGSRFSAGRDHHRKASAFLAWLGSHRERLTVWHVGGKRLVFLVLWDSKGDEPMDHERGSQDQRAIAYIANGPRCYGSSCPMCKQPLLEDEKP